MLAQANQMLANMSDVHLFAWTSNAAFEKYLFRDKVLNQM